MFGNIEKTEFDKVEKIEKVEKPAFLGTDLNLVRRAQPNGHQTGSFDDLLLDGIEDGGDFKMDEDFHPEGDILDEDVLGNDELGTGGDDSEDDPEKELEDQRSKDPACASCDDGGRNAYFFVLSWVFEMRIECLKCELISIIIASRHHIVFGTIIEICL